MNRRPGKKHFFAWLVTLTGMLVSITALAQAPGQFQKCQDAEGQWHYGSRVNAGCQSSISVHNSGGVILRQNNPFRPASSIQLLAVKQQQLSDQRLLQRYSSLSSIELEKERKLAELQKQKTINLELIDKMSEDIQALEKLNSLASESTLQERHSVIRQYQSKDYNLSDKITALSYDYDLLVTDYLQAQLRSNNLTAELGSH